MVLLKVIEICTRIFGHVGYLQSAISFCQRLVLNTPLCCESPVFGNGFDGTTLRKHNIVKRIRNSARILIHVMTFCIDRCQLRRKHRDYYN